MEGLAAKGHAVTLFLNDALAWNPEKCAEVRIDVPYIRGKQLFLADRFRSFLKRHIASSDRTDADWIVIFGETHWKAARTCAREKNIPILFAYRSDSIAENRFYLDNERITIPHRLHLHLRLLIDAKREKEISRHARLIAFQSDSDRNRFVERNPGTADKTKVIRGDIRQPRFKPEYACKNSSAECRKLLFVGTLGRRKGLEYLLRALPAVLSRTSIDLGLDILAAGTDFAPFEHIITESGLSDCVRFHGKSTNPLEFMVSSDLLVVPSLFDSYPNVVLEAFHVGLPVIGSHAGGIPDMIGNPRFLFAPASVESIADLLCALVTSRDKYLELRETCAGRRGYFDFDWAAEWEKVMVLDAEKR